MSSCLNDFAVNESAFLKKSLSPSVLTEYIFFSVNQVAEINFTSLFFCSQLDVQLKPEQ